MHNQSISRVEIASVLPFMLFFVAPLTFYFGNTSEINFSITDVIWPVFGIFFGASAAIFLVLLACYKTKKLQKNVAGLLIGLAASVWIQSQIFVWKFGPLDGRDINWNLWSSHMWLEGIVWFIITLAAVYLLIFKNGKIIKILLRLLFAIGIISIVSTYITSTAEPASKKAIGQGKKLETSFKFYPRNNVIVILLDTFQSDYFELISKEYPDEIKFLDGFTFYRNTMSQYPTTAPNIPAIMTGKVYKNEEKFNNFKREAFSSFDLRKSYSSHGYDSRSVVINGMMPDILTMKEILDYFSISSTAPWREFLDYGLFRSSPTFLKPKIYNNGDWFIAFWGRAKYPPDFHGTDVRFLELFEKEAFIGSSLDGTSGTFTFFHFYIPHPPWRVDEKLQYNSGLSSGRDGYIRQARGALTLARRILEKLKKMDIYNSAEIIIMSDHGTSSAPPVNMLLFSNNNNISSSSSIRNIPSKVHSSALALLLHKKPFSKGDLIVNDSPIMHSEVACLLGVQNDHHDCSEFQSAMKGMQRERKYLFYDWKHEYWQADYMPPMTEYIVDGHVYDKWAWHNGEYRYEPGKKIKQADENIYTIGLPISFTKSGNSNNFILNGWSGQEENHRWTEGVQSALSFRLNKKISSNLIFRLRGGGFYIPGKVDQQLVAVIVNGQQVAQWAMKSENWYQAIIPASLINNDGLINVVFNISNPTAPADFANSEDSRKLGMLVKEILIELAD